MTKIAINGFGRIGRIFFRQAFAVPSEAASYAEVATKAESAKDGGGGIEIVAINDLGTPANLAYLLKYDTVYRRYDKSVTLESEGDKNYLVVSDPPSHEASEGSFKRILLLNEKDPTKLPWGSMGVDVVIESTGVFDSREKATVHLTAGAKRVVITAPAHDDVTPTMTPNVGWPEAGSQELGAITSNASCTTNAINPIVAIMMATIGVEKAVLSTVHGYTATQGLVDGPDKKDDYRRARAAAVNIVPSTTGAAKATVRSIPTLENKFDGIAIRVPVISGSLIDVTFVSSRSTTVEEVNNIFKQAAAAPEWQGIMTVTEDQLVSSDVLGQPYGSIVDLALTRVVDGNLVKVFSWYDNEWGYSAMLLKHVLEVAKLL